MSTTWAVVGLVGVATIAIKAAGPALLGGRELPIRLRGIVALLAPAVLAALVITQTVGGDRSLVLDARVVGVVVAAVAVWRKAPMLVVVVVAAASTAIARAVT